MKQAAIDIGNTFVKIGIFQQETLLEYYEHLKIEDISEILEHERVEHAIVSNVGNPISNSIQKWKNICHVIEVSSQIRLPFQIQYLTPHTLGPDRIALVAGAQTLFPHYNCLCIDAGTCLTFDFLTHDNCYIGGSIAPGLRMRLRAMHEHTASLPLISDIQKITLIGKSTTTCMLSGALNGMIAEIYCMTQKYLQHYPDTKVLISGGDAHFLIEDLPDFFIFTPKLLLTGLNALLMLNLDNKAF